MLIKQKATSYTKLIREGLSLTRAFFALKIFTSSAHADTVFPSFPRTALFLSPFSFFPRFFLLSLSLLLFLSFSLILFPPFFFVQRFFPLFSFFFFSHLFKPTLETRTKNARRRVYLARTFCVNKKNRFNQSLIELLTNL